MSEGHDILFYSGPEGDSRLAVVYRDDTLWLDQRRMSELFGVDRSVIARHLGNIFEEGELDRDSVCAVFAHTALDGKSYNVQFYQLDAIIAVGYRVSSYRATRFRIWATGVLKEFLVKGFALDDARLRQGGSWGKDYFEELLERIREIRASERLFYQKITDIYAQCSLDYDSHAPITREFYATVQNKLHWAIHGHTAAELIAGRADSTKPQMGLTTWKNAPRGKVHKSDVTVARNYLAEEELRSLNRIVGRYLDYAENQAERRIPMNMADWARRLDAFLAFNEYPVLQHLCSVSAAVAKELAETEYEKLRVLQDRTFERDFDREVKRLRHQGEDSAPGEEPPRDSG